MTPIAVVIVNYNTREHLQACLASIEMQGPSEVVVVDNASSDGSVEMVKAAYPWVRLYADKTNPGYGAAANKAIASCTAQYALLLNSDTVLRPGALEALSKYLDRHAMAAMVGPRLVDPDGKLQISCYPFPSPLDRLIRFAPLLRDYYSRIWPHTSDRIVPWILGAAIALRRDAFEAVGGFDESFFMYFEEVDLCYRLAAAGWQVHFSPVTTVVHVGGASTRPRRAAMMAQLFASEMQFYQRHYSKRLMLEFRFAVAAIMVAQIAIDTIHLHWTYDPSQRTLLAENLGVWRWTLGTLHAGGADRLSRQYWPGKPA